MLPCSLFVVTLCDIDEGAIEPFLSKLVSLEESANEAIPLSGFITVSNSTTSGDVCEKSAQISEGAYFMLGAAPVALLAQIIMLLSYTVVAEVSWRHMKDVRKEDERAYQREAGTTFGSAADGGAEMNDFRRQQIANNSRANSNHAPPPGPGGLREPDFHANTFGSAPNTAYGQMPYGTGAPQQNYAQQPPPFGGPGGGQPPPFQHGGSYSENI